METEMCRLHYKLYALHISAKDCSVSTFSEPEITLHLSCQYQVSLKLMACVFFFSSSLCNWP